MSEELYNNDPFMKLNPLIEECIDEFYMNPDDAGKTEFAVMNYFYIIYFIGGFLFSLLWEAKPRYVFPYFYICLPLAAVSLYRITTFLTTWISRLLHDNKRNGDR